MLFEELLLLLAFLLINSGLAAARAALVNAPRARLRQMAEEGTPGAARAAHVAEDSTLLIATLRLAQSLSRFFIAGLVVWLFEPLLIEWGQPWLGSRTGWFAFFSLMIVAALAVVSAGELLPEAWVMRAPETAAIWAAPFVAFLEKILGGPARLILWFSQHFFSYPSGRQPIVTEAEIKTLVDASEEGGAIAEEQKEMIYSVFDFGNTPAREVMVPRIDILALEVNTPLAEATETVVAGGHSRIPVYEGNVDNIVGLLYAKDLLRVGRLCDADFPLRKLLRPAYFVPETKKLDELLAELQRQRIHITLVVDEYGGLAGLVTLEDIVEEIVGEIRDEYDVAEETLVETVGDQEYIFDARLNWAEAAQLLKLEPSAGDYDTLGGFIYSQLGHVPVPGEKVITGGIQFEVLTVSGRRIRKVRACHLAPVSPPPTPAGQNS